MEDVTTFEVKGCTATIVLNGEGERWIAHVYLLQAYIRTYINSCLQSYTHTPVHTHKHEYNFPLIHDFVWPWKLVCILTCHSPYGECWEIQCECSLCVSQLNYSKGVKMSLGNPISMFPAGNQRPGLSCLGACIAVVCRRDFRSHANTPTRHATF